SAHLREPEAPFPVAFGEERLQGRAASALHVLDATEGFATRLLEQVAVAHQVARPQPRQTPLPGTEEVTGPADLEVALRDREAVLGRDHHVHPRPRLVRQPPVAEKHTAGRMRAAA